MSTENKEDIAKLIRRCVKLFGRPISVMRDLSGSIDMAVNAELSDKGVVNLLCHYHFLENVGTRLCAKLHVNLTKRLRKLKVRAAMKAVRHDLVKGNKTGVQLSEQQILEILEDPKKALALDAVQLHVDTRGQDQHSRGYLGDEHLQTLHQCMLVCRFAQLSPRFAQHGIDEGLQ